MPSIKTFNGRTWANYKAVNGLANITTPIGPNITADLWETFEFSAAAAKDGAVWRDLGGHNLGRKAVMLLAGLILNDPNILAYADASQHFIFQEDRQTWYVRQYDVGRVLYTADGRPREQYIQADVGLPEWGEQHTSQENRDGRNYTAAYRDIGGKCFTGHRLAMGLTRGAQTYWAWDAFFDYSDRYWTWYFAEGGDSSFSSSNPIPAFTQSMWTSYWGLWSAPSSPPVSCLATPASGSSLRLTWV